MTKAGAVKASVSVVMMLLDKVDIGLALKLRVCFIDPILCSICMAQRNLSSSLQLLIQIAFKTNLSTIFNKMTQDLLV